MTPNSAADAATSAATATSADLRCETCKFLLFAKCVHRSTSYGQFRKAIPTP